MKTITLHIDDDAFEDIQVQLSFKTIAGEMYGVLDDFLFLLVRSIMDDKQEIRIAKGRREQKKPEEYRQVVPAGE